VKAYWSQFRVRIKVLLAYRAAALAGVTTQIFWGFVKIMIIEGFYRSATKPPPITLVEAIGYIWLGQAFLVALVPWSGERELQEQIRSGAVCYDLLRPTDLYTFWFMRVLAMRTAPLFLRTLPLFALTMLILPLLSADSYSLHSPQSFTLFFAFCLTLLGGIVLSCAITMLFTISTLWTLSGEGVNSILPTFVVVFSGMIIPLPLFPDWLQPILTFLPFSGLFDKPFRFFVGNLPFSALTTALLHQFLWCVALIGLGRFLVNRGVKKLVIQGG
jgi:ABC-2 type transport system permease protein